MSVSSLPILLTGATLVTGKCHNSLADLPCQSTAPQGLQNAIVWANRTGLIWTSKGLFMNYESLKILPLMSRDSKVIDGGWKWTVCCSWNKKWLFLGCKFALQVTLIREVTSKSIRLWGLAVAFTQNFHQLPIPTHPAPPTHSLPPRSAVQPDGNSKWPS